VPESVLERRVSRLLAARALPVPQRQLRIYDEAGLIGRVDFAFPSHKVILEVDGYRFHSAKAHWEKDRERRNRLEAAGWRVLHTTYAQLRSRPEAIIEPLRKLLRPELPGT
jgi:very-short-patch-repair endonuclease